MVTAVVESPPRQRQRHRLSAAPLAGGSGDFELRHCWRPVVKKRASGMQGRRWTPPEIEIPDGGGGGVRGYTSLRDIMSSPEYAAAKASSPGEAGGVGTASCGDVHMIRHPLVKHAAYAYLQLTPSAREEARRRRRRRGPLCRLLLGCLGFVGALFGR
ncbi:hypothetical protein ACP70R_047894 [Stipagrostis hirtigluma subsp. patula]